MNRIIHAKHLQKGLNPWEQHLLPRSCWEAGRGTTEPEEEASHTRRVLTRTVTSGKQAFSNATDGIEVTEKAEVGGGGGGGIHHNDMR